MTAIRKQLLDIFAGDEPDYERAAAMGPVALPVLRKMVGENADLAAQAVCVAGLQGSRDALEIIAIVTRSDDADLRASAAGALGEFAVSCKSSDDLDSAFELLTPLLDDSSPTVRRFAQRAAAAFPDGAHHHVGRNAGS